MEILTFSDDLGCICLQCCDTKVVNTKFMRSFSQNEKQVWDTRNEITSPTNGKQAFASVKYPQGNILYLLNLTLL